MLRFKFALVVVLFAASSAHGQNPYVLDVYGDGVHAYHCGNRAKALEQFNKAVQYGSRDPRVYYFRALKALEEGDSGTAEQEIRTGVMYELRGQGTWDIGMALARVQGTHRIEFENRRLDAKLELSEQPMQPSRPDQPYMDPSMIDQQPLADELDGPSLGNDPFADDEDEEADASDLNLDDAPEDPPADDAIDDESMEFDDASDDVPESSDDPIMDDAGSDDPFADDGGTDVDASAGDDPFADDAGAGDDPFADDAAGDDPFADDALEDDPFE